MKDNLIDNFESIYNEKSDDIFRFCLIKVSDRQQALDLTQETFLRLWQTLLSGEVIKNEKAFLFTVARRLVIDWYRKKKNLPIEVASTSVEESEEVELLDEKTELDNIVVKAEGRYLLEKINDLPNSYKDPVYLRFVEDLSPPEIGEILGITENAASVRINRGLEELRKLTGYSKK